MQIISVVIHFPDSPRPIFAVPFHALRVKCIYLFTARNDSRDIINSSLVITTLQGRGGGEREREGVVCPRRKSLRLISHRYDDEFVARIHKGPGPFSSRAKFA